MTKEITKARILQEIQDKFKLRELAPDIFSFSEMVVPTYSVEPHLTAWVVKHNVVSITSAASFEFFTVPDNERWTLRGYLVLFAGAAGAYKVSGLLIRRSAVAGEYIYLDLKKAQDESYIVNLPHPVVLEHGTIIEVLVDTYVSTQNLSLKLDVLIEEER